MKLYLIGLPGVGKSRIGNKLAKRLGLDFYDVDDIILNTFDSPSNIITNQGEEHFRRLETKVLRELRNVEGIISTGGGIVVTSDNKHYMNGIVIYLETSPKAINISEDEKEKRPILKEKSIVELFLERECQYLNFSDIIIDVENKTDDEIINEVIKQI